MSTWSTRPGVYDPVARAGSRRGDDADDPGLPGGAGDPPQRRLRPGEVGGRREGECQAGDESALVAGPDDGRRL